MFAASVLGNIWSNIQKTWEKDFLCLDFNDVISPKVSSDTNKNIPPSLSKKKSVSFFKSRPRSPPSLKSDSSNNDMVTNDSASSPSYRVWSLQDLKEAVAPSLNNTVQSTCALPYRLFEGAGDLMKTKIQQQSVKVQHTIRTFARGLEKLNMDLDENIVTLNKIKEAHSFLKTCADMVRTPTLLRVEKLFSQCGQSSTQNSSSKDEAQQIDLNNVKLYLKLENMQTTGSFKIRGVLNQMHLVKEKHGENAKLITMSAGNYGKAFAHCVGKSGNALCLMPNTAPENRSDLIQSMGVNVQRVPSSDLQEVVDSYVDNEGYVFCHPFDDPDLIAGYASCGLELLEDVPDPDVVLVCCGGGGFVSGVASAISLSKVENCRVYGVEPETAPTMYESFKARRPMKIPSAKSIAAGLAPPYAGTNCYKHCRWFVEDILTVSDEEILHAMKILFDRGIKAEPSGCAALAALLTGKVPDVQGKKVVVLVTGGNVSAAELNKLMPEN